MRSVQVEVVLERKHAATPVFVVVPAAKLKAWKLAATTTVEGTLDGHALGRRSLKRWDDTRWFVELRRELVAALGKQPGERAKLVIAPATDELPPELLALLEREPAARARWEACTSAQQRMLREELFTVKGAATRERRARAALLPAPKKPAPRVAGLSPEPRALCIRIQATHLPGRSCGPYRDVAVGFVPKTGCCPDTFVPADARSARWETEVEVLSRNGAPAFRGPAVNGPAHERFLYLTWLGRLGSAPPAMFRRAKLRLDTIPAATLTKALRTGVLVGRLGLTAPDGMPLCASVRPPVIAWSER